MLTVRIWDEGDAEYQIAAYTNTRNSVSSVFCGHRDGDLN